MPFEESVLISEDWSVTTTNQGCLEQPGELGPQHGTASAAAGSDGAAEMIGATGVSLRAAAAASAKPRATAWTRLPLPLQCARSRGTLPRWRHQDQLHQAAQLLA